MIRLVVCTVLGASLLAALPHYASRMQETLEARRQTEAADAATAAQQAQARLEADAQPAYRASYAGGRSMRIAPDAQGHFNGQFRINGRTVEGLVDTGATYVAMNMSTARKLGVAPAGDAFTFGVSTANGETRAARVTLDRMEIGPIRVEDVEAFVLEDANLAITLVGMSFMSRLETYRVENGELLMMD
ncbi:TIGR02281 family clan AA aspartic protease [Pararhizobium haloflavum]|uniref:TIGR02281 family clan AA aspartic protease n=1 Tax=Pararhizobium haloflavum TaxID=2037914 RepID=UPI000C179500|nr:TIGR02281 family clan AA aspartic protease [Pararhizobium haloflavum]